VKAGEAGGQNSRGNSSHWNDQRIFQGTTIVAWFVGQTIVPCGLPRRSGSRPNQRANRQVLVNQWPMDTVTGR
jgi:hypothetical protein